jgi:hypothetical protein
MFPLIIGLLAKYAATADAQKRQAKLQEAMRAYQLQQAAGNESAIRGLMDQQSTAARGAELQNIQGSRATSMQAGVDAVRSAAPTSVVAGAAASPDYQKASAAAADTVANRTKRAIQQMSIMGAPGEQAQQFGLRFGRAAGKVDAGNTAIGNVGNAYMNAIRNTVPDPMLSLAGDGLMAYGSSGATAGTTAVNNGQGYEDASGNLYSDNVTRQKSVRKPVWPAGWGS